MKRGFLWLEFTAATLVVVGVFLQAFSITAYVRGAGEGALDMHGAVGGVTHLIEVVVFLAALVAWWKQWGEVALAFSLPLIGTIQLFLVGDTDKDGGWVNGLHGLFALVVLVLAAVIAHRAMKALGLRGGAAAA
jgi:hypothetical protein